MDRITLFLFETKVHNSGFNIFGAYGLRFTPSQLQTMVE